MVKLEGSKLKAYALFGLLLGDGYLNPHNGSRQIRCEHTNKQREYVKMLAKFCSTNNLEYSTRFDYVQKTQYGEYTYSGIAIKTPKVDQHFKTYNRFFDNTGKKIVSDYVLKRISPLGLLFWFLDDGCLSVSIRKDRNSTTRQATLATQGFTYQDNLKIQKMFLSRFGIETKIHKDKKYFKQYFSAIEFRKFYDIVRPFLNIVPKDMRYKFNMKYTANPEVPESLRLCEKYNFE